ncbi:hypothetical protein DFP73DRAFT_596316 [Morchella snyderi]|nr:hypothetical protein DFP73DRAFT_596316 [Morchella snyderi]
MDLMEYPNRAKARHLHFVTLLRTSANSPISQGVAHTPWAPGAARAECSRLAMLKPSNSAQRRQGRVAPPLCLGLPEQSVQAPSAARAEYLLPALPEQCARVRSCQSSVLASGATRAEYSHPALPEQSARVGHCQSRMLISGVARAEYLFPPLHAASPSQSTRSTQYQAIHPPSGDHSPILYSPAAARASYLRPLSTP